MSGYDTWKACEPDYYDDPGYIDESDYDACDHEEYDVDWEGRATCDYCSRQWWLTAEQLERWDAMQADHAAEYDRMQRRENSRFWRANAWLRGRFSRRAFARLYLRLFKRGRIPKWIPDDEIPF